MPAPFVYFGIDVCHRVLVLKNAGYAVEDCRSVTGLYSAVVRFPDLDAVAVSESKERGAESNPTMRRAMVDNLSDSNRVGIELMIADSRIALTFLDMAETTTNAGDRSRRLAEAHHAYRTIVSFLPRLSPTPEQAEVLNEEIEKLRARLIAAGMRIDQ